MVFSGGCSLFVLASFAGQSNWDIWGAVLVLGGIPFGIGLAAFLLAQPKD